MRIDAALLGRMLALATRDAHDRPRLRCVVLDGATFVGPATFAGVAFTDAAFDGAAFEGDTSFDDAAFDGHARFGGATFAGTTGFARARFDAQAWFSGASFSGDANFTGAAFGGAAWFGAATFSADALFHKAFFARETSFNDAAFGGHASFAEAEFEGEATLERATFTHEPRYDDARFRGPSGAPKAAARQVAWTGPPLAGWSTRAAAALIDHALPAGLVAAAILLSVVLRWIQYAGTLPVLLAVAAVGSGVVIVRNLIDQGWTGQSAGKRRLGICLVAKSDGQPVGVRLSLLRYGLHLLDTLPLLLGWLAPLWSPTRQTFADRMVTTVVVHRRGWTGAAPVRAEQPEPKPSTASAE